MKKAHSAARPPKSRRDYVLFAAISLAVALVVFLCGSIAWFLWQRNHYQLFVSALSDSTLYAFQNDSLTGRQDGQDFVMPGQTGYQLYNLLSNWDGKPRRKVPQQSPDLTLSYGDGSVLELWPVELDGDTQREIGILFRFTSSDGETWIYDTDRFGPNTLDKLSRP